MPRKPARKNPIKKQRFAITFGSMAFIAIFLVAYLALLFPVNATALILLLSVLGIAVGIFNIRAEEERDFPLSITALNVIIIAWLITIDMPLALRTFLTNLAVAFGVAGIIIALAVIIRTGSTR